MDSSPSRARKALLPVLSLGEAEEAVQQIFAGKTEDSRDSLGASTYAASTTGSSSCRASTVRSSCGPLSSSTFIGGIGSPQHHASPHGSLNDSASRARKALLPVLSFAEAEAAIHPIFAGSIADSLDSLDVMSPTYSTSSTLSSPSRRNHAARPPPVQRFISCPQPRLSFAEKRAERETTARGTPRDHLDCSARRGIMSAIFAAKVEQQVPPQGNASAEHAVACAEGKLTAAFLFETSRPDDF